jgi:hypothetical protein
MEKLYKFLSLFLETILHILVVVSLFRPRENKFEEKKKFISVISMF